MVTAKKTGAKSGSAAGKSAHETKTETHAKAQTSGMPGMAGMPFVDIGQMLNQFKLPGVDLAELMKGRKKDIEAVSEANRLAYEGMKALGKRQAEMMTEAMAEWRAAAPTLTAMNPGDIAAKRGELAKQVFGKMLSNMRELAEMAAASQTQAGEIVTQRFQENLAEMRKVLNLK